VAATSQRRADRADVGDLVTAEVGPLDLEADLLVRSDHRVVKGCDGREAPVPASRGVEGRGADRIGDHRVGGEQPQPGLAVLRAYRCL
jgi:hypothetical protein